MDFIREASFRLGKEKLKVLKWSIHANTEKPTPFTVQIQDQLLLIARI